MSRTQEKKAKRGFGKGELAVLVFLILVGLGLLGVSAFGFISKTATPIIKLDTLSTTGGTVDNSTHSIDMAIVRFNQTSQRLGVTTTTILPTGDLLSSTMNQTGDIDITSSNTTIPHVIKYQNILYRQLPSVSNNPGTNLDGPANEIWTTDMLGFKSTVNQYLTFTSPSSLLSDFRDIWNAQSTKVNKDKSTVLSFSVKQSAISSSLAAKYGLTFDPINADPVWFYVTLSPTQDINRVMVVLPGNQVFMVSYDGAALKAVNKPDLTHVAPNLSLGTPSATPSATIPVTTPTATPKPTLKK